MPRPIINGTLARVRQSQVTKFDPTNGRVVTKNWAGAGPGNLTGYATDLERLGIPYELTETGVKCTLVETATDVVGAGTSSADPPQRFDILYNEAMFDIKQSPNWISLDETKRGLLLKDVERYHDGKTLKRDWTSVDVDIQLKLDDYFNLLLSGTIHFPVSQWVFRHVFTIPSDLSFASLYPTSLDTGIGAVYSTAQLLSEIPTAPARIHSKIGSITIVTVPVGYILGWRKHPTSEITTSQSRLEASFEYQFGLWSRQLYSAA